MDSGLRCMGQTSYEEKKRKFGAVDAEVENCLANGERLETLEFSRYKLAAFQWVTAM
jgi:hypothetical protein